MTSPVQRIAARFVIPKIAGPLTDVSKLRYQAVFLMGAGGSGKGYASHKWLKYMPGGGMSGAAREKWEEKVQEKMTEAERGLTNLEFEKASKRLEQQGILIEPVEGGGAKMPFRLYTYDKQNRERLIPPERWEAELPPSIYKDVEGLEELIFSAPVHELPSYWRQINPDIYKEEISGYMEELPGYVHEMSSEMSKAYFEAAAETGDPLFVDGTGANAKKMVRQMAALKEAGYKVSLVLIFVPLTVNHIRNATRSRNVPPRIVTGQWHTIRKNYVALKGMADVSKVVINRNDRHDAKVYNNNAEKIDRFIRKGYGGEHEGLRDLILDESPTEVPEWDRMLNWKKGALDVDPRAERIRSLRQEKGIKRRYGRRRR